MAMGRRFTGPSGRAWRDEARRVGSRLRGGLLGQDGLDELGHEDAVVVDERLEGDAGGGTGMIVLAGSSSPVSGSRKSSALRSTRRDGAVELAELDDLGLLRGDRQDDDLLLAVEDRLLCPVPGLAFGSSVPVSAGGGGRSVPTTWRPWSSALTLVLFTPATS